MIQTTFLVVLSVLSVTFFFLFYIQKKKNIQILAQTIELLMMQEENQKHTKTEKEQFNEDFLKFISDSREYAFKYIELTQDKVNSFINDVGPVIDYLEAYAPPVLAETQRISLVDGYKIIKTILLSNFLL